MQPKLIGLLVGVGLAVITLLVPFHYFGDGLVALAAGVLIGRWTGKTF